jgi:hypothetical protein
VKNPPRAVPTLTPEVVAGSLSIEEIESTAQGFKADLQREINRKIRRHDPTGALATLEAIEYVDKFVFTLKLRAGSQIGRPARARPIRLFKKQR